MLDLKRMAGLALAWLALVTGAHFWLNVDWSALLNDRLPLARRKLVVAYLPVT
ncbi:MAG TPA: hypothetical protein VE075_07600 [Thermoanaerobaculia bacterium]|nr:hypothetical protein [Thermoanaerobaculia bacterium]